MTLAEVMDFELLANADVSHAFVPVPNVIWVTYRDGSLGVLKHTEEDGWQWLGVPQGLDGALFMAGGFNA